LLGMLSSLGLLPHDLPITFFPVSGHAAKADVARHERGQAIVAAVEPVVLDRHVLARDVAGFLKAFTAPECPAAIRSRYFSDRRVCRMASSTSAGSRALQRCPIWVS